MDDSFGRQLHEVFSVLPDAAAARTARQLAQRFIDGEEGFAPEIGWVDFDTDGRVLRAGVTAPDDLSTRLFAPTALPEDLLHLVEAWRSGLHSIGSAVPLGDNCECLAWFSPAMPNLTGDGEGAAAVRGLTVREPVFGRLIDQFTLSQRVTPAEKRALFQLTAGLGPREAAESDGVSFETRRAQIKSLCAKLGCTGQTDLVRKTVGQLVHLLHLSAAGNSESRAVERFARRHLPADVRLTVHMLGHGRALRSFECGPPGGRPVVLAHGLLFPLVLLNSEEGCRRHGVRLIVPLRSGYLDEQSPLALLHPVDRWRDQDDVARFMEGLGGAVPVIGHSIGASWAIELAARYPSLVSSLVLLSPNFLEDRPPKSIFGNFLHGLRTVATQPGMLRYVAWQFRQQFADRRVIRQVLRRTCGEQRDDLAVIDGTVGAGPVDAWFKDGYRASIVGIADDTDAIAADWRRLVEQCPVDVSVISATGDPVARLADWRSELSHAEFRILEEGGHFVVASHPRRVWAEIAELLELERPRATG